MSKYALSKLVFVCLFLTLLLLYVYKDFQVIYFFFLVLLCFVYSIVLFLGAYFIQLNFFVKAFNKGDGAERRLALTFDDGPHANTSEILALLAVHQAKATFFLIGKNCIGRESMVKQVMEEGHVIANHSYSHSTMYSMLSPAKMLADMQQNNELLFQITGKKIKWFRPPYGVSNPRVAKALEATNFDVIGWNVRSLDTAIADDEKVFERIKSRLVGDDIVLLHDSIENTAQVLKRLLLYCEKEQIRIVPLAELINRAPYE